MQFNLLDNGIDSLRATGDILLEYYLDYEFEGYQIKDAIFHFMHGVEIIAKYLLQEKDEKLLFKDSKEYQNAKHTMLENNYSSVFAADPNIRTIDVMTALKRFNSQSRLRFDEDYLSAIDNLKLHRNQLMHYTVNLTNSEFVSLVTLLRQTFERSLIFFKKMVPAFEERFNKVQREEPITEYHQYLDDLEAAAMSAHEDARWDYEAEMMDALESQALKESK